MSEAPQHIARALPKRLHAKGGSHPQRCNGSRRWGRYGFMTCRPRRYRPGGGIA